MHRAQIGLGLCMILVCGCATVTPGNAGAPRAPVSHRNTRLPFRDMCTRAPINIPDQGVLSLAIVGRPPAGCEPVACAYIYVRACATTAVGMGNNGTARAVNARACEREVSLRPAR